jgi:biotin carboxyl carrier protein
MSLGKAGVLTKGDYYLKAPMPGLVVSVPVKKGQMISQGDILIILESMKMQNELKSPLDGTVLRLQVNPADTIQQDEVMLVLSPLNDQ